MGKFKLLPSIKAKYSRLVSRFRYLLLMTFTNHQLKKYWDTANVLRKNLDAAEYKHIVLGLVFLKYVSDYRFVEPYLWNRKVISQTNLQILDMAYGVIRDSWRPYTPIA